MDGGFLHRIRRQPRFPRPHVLTGALAVALYITVFLGLAYVAGGDAPQRFFLEGRAVDAMSALFLAMGSGFAVACLIFYPGQRRFGALLWLCSAMGLLFLALDDQLEIHETVGSLLEQPLGSSKAFRNWNDVLVIAYGIVALGFAAMFLPEIVRYPRLLLLLGIGFSFYVAHTAIDSLVEASGGKSIVEESAKLYSTGFFMLAMFAGLQSIVLARDESKPAPHVKPSS